MNRRLKKVRQTTDSIGLYNEQEMARIHEYERLRTDRNGMKFSHITLGIDFKQLPARKLNSFIAGITGRLRMTDHIGWESTNSIGVILPGTDEVGARHFIKNTQELIKDLSGISVELTATHPLPETLLAAVSATAPMVEATEPAEAEEVSILPFK